MNFAIIMSLITALLGGGVTAASLTSFEQSAAATDIKAFLTAHPNVSELEVKAEKDAGNDANMTATSTKAVNLEVKLEADNGAKLEREVVLESASTSPSTVILENEDKRVRAELENENEHEHDGLVRQNMDRNRDNEVRTKDGRGDDGENDR